MAWDTPFDEFSVDDRAPWVLKASQWYASHKIHVEGLMLEESEAYPPSGSDCGKPELWKAGHWRWFFRIGNK